MEILSPRELLLLGVLSVSKSMPILGNSWNRGRPIPPEALIGGEFGTGDQPHLLLAMQKVVGSNPISCYRLLVGLGVSGG